MKQVAKLLFSVIIVLTMSSCFDTVEFPATPEITFESLNYKDTEGVDSLILSFRFQDGDGNIGLNNDFADLFKPFQVYSVIIDDLDSLVTISGDGYTLPFYAAPVIVDPEIGTPFFPSEKELFSETDMRPSYNCEDYEIFGVDTFYVARNEFHYNFHVEFQERRNGNYEKIDFRTIFNSDDCTLGNFNGRIPLFDPSGKEGVISYAMLSQAFRLAFQDDTIRMEFYIYDKSLNKSNVEVTPDFVLRDLF
ncbi:MAG: hypothetical protein RIM99_18045 [Cyclobacteriaceae bacterium]